MSESARMVSNVIVGKRLRQFIFLVLVTTAGMMISCVVNAQTYHHGSRHRNIEGKVTIQKEPLSIVLELDTYSNAQKHVARYSVALTHYHKELRT